MIRLVVSILLPDPLRSTKETESFTEKGEFGPQASSISGRLPGGDTSASTLAGWYNPLTGFLPYEVTVERRLGITALLVLSASVLLQSITHTGTP